MALTVTITKVARLGNEIRVGFKLVPSGTYTTGGDIINFATAGVDATYVGPVPSVIALGAPLQFDVWSQGGNITTQYVAVIGTTIANCKMKGLSALATEFTGGSAYPASALADTIVGEASFVAL